VSFYKYQCNQSIKNKYGGEFSMQRFEDEEKKSLLDPSQPRTDEVKAPTLIITGALQLRGEQKIPARGNLRHHPLGAVLDEYFYIGDKPFGVEPGFLAVEINMKLLNILQEAGVIIDKLPEHKDPLSREQKIEVNAFLKAQMDALHTQIDMTKLETEEPESKIIPLAKILIATGKDPEKIARLEKLEAVLSNLKKDCMNPQMPKKSRITLWLIKQDYNKGKPYPPDDRLASTTAVKTSIAPSLALAVYRAKKKKDASFEDESINAILENLANDVAGLVMRVQEQKLHLRAGDEKTDTTQFVTVCKWEPELEMFTGCLAGSASDNKYYVDLERDENSHIIKGRDLQILSKLPPKDQQKANQYYLVRSDIDKPWKLYRTDNTNKLSEIPISEMPELKAFLNEDHSKTLPSQLTTEAKTTVIDKIDIALQERQKEKDALIEGLKVLNLEIVTKLPPEAERKSGTSYLVKESEDKPWALYRIDAEKKSHEVQTSQIAKPIISAGSHVYTVATLSDYLSGHKKSPKDLTAAEIEIMQKEVMNFLYADEKEQLKVIKKSYGEDYHRGPIPRRDENDFFTSDKKLSLGEYAPLMLLLADNDSIGSNGQNKGQVNRELFGLDFGHAFRGKSKKFGFDKEHTKNPLLDHMHNDFSFDNPKFKNIGSLFYDSTLSERMQGMFILYKLMGDANRKRIFGEDTGPSSEIGKINAAIELYKEKYPKFEEKLATVKDGGLPEVFKQYKDKMQELIDTTKDPKQQEQYKKYLARVETAEKFAFNSFQQIAKKLKHRMPLGPDAVDLLHNMEKLTSKTSIASENGTVLLKHMRVDNPKNRVKWHMKIATNGSVSLECSASPKRTKELQTILHEYMNQARTQIEIERKKLKSNQQDLSPDEFLKQAKILADKEQNLSDFKVDIGTTYTGRVYIKCSEKHLAELCEIFQEDRIKQLKPKVALTLDVTPDAVKEKLPQYEGLLRKKKPKVDMSDLPGLIPIEGQESKLSREDSSPAVSESKLTKKPRKWPLTTTSLFSLFKIKRKVDAEIKQVETPTAPSPEKANLVVDKTPKTEKANDSSFTSESKHNPSSTSSRPGRSGSGHAA